MEPLYTRFSHSATDECGRLKEFRIDCPDNFNFAYDVVDTIAKEDPNRTALIYCNEEGLEKTISFEEMSRLSSQAAACLRTWASKKATA